MLQHELTELWRAVTHECSHAVAISALAGPATLLLDFRGDASGNCWIVKVAAPLTAAESGAFESAGSVGSILFDLDGPPPSPPRPCRFPDPGPPVCVDEPPLVPCPRDDPRTFAEDQDAAFAARQAARDLARSILRERRDAAISLANELWRRGLVAVKLDRDGRRLPLTADDAARVARLVAQLRIGG
jgi:hypothetical protein